MSMSLIDQLLSRFGYYKTREVSNPPDWLLASSRVGIPDGSVYGNQAELMQRLSWVNIAVSTIARAAAVTPLNVMEYDGEDTEDIPNHPFEELINSPNPLQSRFEFIEATLSWRMLTGNCYIWLNRTSQKDEPLEMWVLPSNCVRPVPDEKMYLRGYMYNSGSGGEIPLELYEITHLKSFNPSNPYVGLSPIEAIAIVAEGDLGMQKWNTQLFTESNARLPGILSFADPISDSDWERIKKDTVDNSAKRQMMMLRNVKAGGVQWIQATATQREMEFLSGRKANRQEIFDAFGPGLYAMLSENATEANSRTAKATFAEYTLWPLLMSIAEKFSNDILTAYGENLKCDFDDPRVTDRAMEMAEVAEFSKYHTIDEVRIKYFNAQPLADITKLDGDMRGYLLVAQISPNTPIEEEPEPEPIAPMAPILPNEQPGEQTGESMSEPEEVEEEAPDQDEENVKSELAKWKRKSIKAIRAGKSPLVEFIAEFIDAETCAGISNQLSRCKSESDVKIVFDGRAVRIAKNFPAESGSAEIPALLRAIELGVEALRVEELRVEELRA